LKQKVDRDDAIGKGFRILFKYISGENKNKESISMTDSSDAKKYRS
jgi:hypothetical protein